MQTRVIGKSLNDTWKELNKNIEQYNRAQKEMFLQNNFKPQLDLINETILPDLLRLEIMINAAKIFVKLHAEDLHPLKFFQKQLKILSNIRNYFLQVKKLLTYYCIDPSDFKKRAEQAQRFSYAQITVAVDKLSDYVSKKEDNITKALKKFSADCLTISENIAKLIEEKNYLTAKKIITNAMIHLDKWIEYLNQFAAESSREEYFCQAKIREIVKVKFGMMSYYSKVTISLDPNATDFYSPEQAAELLIKYDVLDELEEFFPLIELDLAKQEDQTWLNNQAINVAAKEMNKKMLTFLIQKGADKTVLREYAKENQKPLLTIFLDSLDKNVDKPIMFLNGRSQVYESKNDLFSLDEDHFSKELESIDDFINSYR